MKVSKLTVILFLIVLGMGYMLFKDTPQRPANRPAVPDTIFIDKPFVVERVKEVEKEVPVEVVEYRTDTVEIEKIRVVRDTVRISTGLGSDILYSARFLTNYPKSPKLLALDLDDEQLSFTGMATDGSVREERFEIDSGRNRYLLRPDGNGWVGLEKRDYGFWRDLWHERFDHDLAIGKYLHKKYPYAAYRASVRLYNNLKLGGEARVSERFNVGLEVSYEID